MEEKRYRPSHAHPRRSGTRHVLNPAPPPQSKSRVLRYTFTDVIKKVKTFLIFK